MDALHLTNHEGIVQTRAKHGARLSYTIPSLPIVLDTLPLARPAHRIDAIAEVTRAIPAALIPRTGCSTQTRYSYLPFTIRIEARLDGDVSQERPIITGVKL